MKKTIILALVLTFALSSCNETKKEDITTNTGDTEKLNTLSGKTDSEIKDSSSKTNSGDTEKINTTTNSGSTSESATGKLQINKEKQTMRKLQNGDVVAIMTTNKGKIEIFLDTKNAPITTANFIGLAKKDYYNGIIFHRVIKGFMIQGGDPTGTGMGGESMYGEKFMDEFSPELRNKKFSISMANSGQNTNGSQFFINVANNNNLDFDKEPLSSKHAVFGEVVSGEDNVLAISKVKTAAQDKPVSEVKIIKLEIKQFENGKYNDYKFDVEKAKKEYSEYTSGFEAREKAAKQKELEAKKDLKIASGSMVTLNFTLKHEDGKEVTSTTTQLQIMEKAEMLSGLNDSLKGLKIGDKKTLTLTPDIGYGEYREDLKQEVPRDKLEQSFAQYGMKLEKGAETPVGKILEIKDKTVLIDSNNPFAGKTMIIDFEVKDIQS